MLAIAMGWSLRIKDAEFDTPPFTLEDFDIVDLFHGSESLFLDTDNQTVLAEMCIRAAELCKLITGVVELQFSVLASNDAISTAKGNDATTATMLFLKSFSPNEQLVQGYDEQLQTWYRTLPSSCFHGAQAGQGDLSPCFHVNAASLRITFWAVVSALHRSQLRSRDKAASMKRVVEAAIEMSRVDREMHRARLDKYLPPTAISFQFPVFLAQTERLKNQDTGGMTEILDSLFFCIKIVETLQELFVAGDGCLNFITNVAKRADITLLYNQDSKLWGIEYRGVHYSPGSRQLNFDSRTIDTGFGDVSPPRIPGESTLETDGGQLEETVNQNDPELPSFGSMDAIDRASLSDILPGCDMEFEHSFGMMVNLDCLWDVQMG